MVTATSAGITAPARANLDGLNLDALAKRINEEHSQVGVALTKGVQHAKSAGELLLQAKAQCQHGEWLPWLEENFEGSATTAQAYMRLARNWPQLEAANAQRVADLSFREALKQLAGPVKPDSDRLAQCEATIERAFG